MNTVKELNGLAEKMVGTNPKAKLDAEAISYIKNNYEGGGGTQSKFDYIIPQIDMGYSSNYTIEDENINTILDEIEENCIDENGNLRPLKIGLFIKFGEEGENIFGFYNVDITRLSGGTDLRFYANCFYNIFVISKASNGWKISKSSLA